ncbi:porin [Pseudoalteromonas sp. S16_S37]|uniref:porin n=1 Tax=Pseudoalteromonas sp. S16_S37 TaxID=2720228 RepID=UPI001680EBAC|nr:porin [Pseudoalteromonas sp. S16_S37]MBD1584348.1 porin [Pseudoalteromonas sp. S16_S37]
MKKRLLAVALCCAVNGTAFGADIRINGFASIVAGKATDDNMKLFDYEDDISFSNESMVALQITSDLGDGLSATGQLVARGNEDYDAEFAWAYISYDVSDNLRISAGRMRLPLFRYSDFIEVGYAYRWVRPPTSVYSLSTPAPTGISVLYTSTLGSWDSAIQAVYGRAEGDFKAITNKDDGKLNDITGLNWTLSKDWLTLRASYMVGETTISLNNSASLVGLSTLLKTYGLQEELNKLAIDKDDGTFLGLGFAIDYNNFLLDGEYTEIEAKDSLLPEQSQYYVSVGYRMQDWTVHLTYEGNDDKHPDSRFNKVPATITLANGATVPLSTDPSNPNAPLVRNLLNSALKATHVDTSTLTIGARYDFHPSAAFKIDWSRQDNDLTNQDNDVIAVAIDLVF